ncbi:hypothetical protein CTRU02_203671 [Colletotrichum truncatum]|uniref:Uncharacterized protein n=1 Tax=Colletotrichum truncatum TaxID=5467 RepID=A0ACC3ZAN4_COLTU
MGERTGSRVFQWVWSYVLGHGVVFNYILTAASFRPFSIPSCSSLPRVL